MRTPPRCRPPFSAALFVTLVLTACGGGDGDRIPAGDLFDRPEPIGEEALELLGTSDNLARVVDLEVADDGWVWLLNAAPPFFVALDADGREVTSGGQRGGGPGEFGQPAALVRLDSGIWSWDARRGALGKVSGAGGLSAGSGMRSLPLPGSDGAPMRAAVFNEMLLAGARAWVEGRGDAAILARIPWSTTGGILHLWDAEFVAVDVTSTGAEVAEIFAATPHLASPKEKYPGAEFYLPVPLWSQCPDGTMVAYDPVRNALVHVDGMGSALGSAGLPPARELEATADRMFEELMPQIMAAPPPGGAQPPIDELRAAFMAEFEEVRVQLARVMPEYRELACARGAGGMHGWLHVLDTGRGATGAGGRWLRMSLSGDAEARVFRMPERFRPMRFRDGVAWGVAYDDLEIPYVARLGLPD